jgi:hypothetical protein
MEALSGSLNHADRVTPFRSYCAGLILPGGRQSVEPIASRIEPGRVQATHQSLHWWQRRTGQTRLFWPRCVRRCCQRSGKPAPSTPGSSTTPDFPRRGPIRWAWRGNIAVSLASSTIARSRSLCRWPMTRQACRSTTGCICRSHGRAIRRDEPARGSLRRNIPDQATDCVWTDPGSHCGRCAPCLRADRSRIRHRYGIPRWHDRTWDVLRRRHPVLHQPLAARRVAAADQASGRNWSPLHARAALFRAQAHLGQDARGGAA